METTVDSANPKRIWWITLLKGVLLLALGIWMFKMPRESFEAMAFIIGLVVVLAGVAEALASYFLRKTQGEWGYNVFGGAMDIIVGIFLMTNPIAIFTLITFFISFLLILLGIMVIRRAILMKQLGQGTWVRNLIFGILILAVAIAIIWHPQILGLTMVFWLAISFISLGVFRIMLAFNANSLLKGRQS